MRSSEVTRADGSSPVTRVSGSPGATGAVGSSGVTPAGGSPGATRAGGSPGATRAVGSPGATRGSGSSDVALVSGEAVHLDIRLARAGSRALALLLDIIVQLALFMALSIVVPIAVAVLPFADQALLSAAYIVLIATILVGYPALCHALLRGRSVGKLAMGLRVVRSDGGPINFRQSLIRALVGTALEWPGILIGLSWLVSLSLLVGSARAQRLADMAAGTIVIHERTPESWGWIPSTPPQLVTWAATLDLTDVDDQLALAARHFLARSRSLREPHRTRIGEALAKEMLTRLTPPPPPNTPGWAYLAAVVGERHRRAAARLTQARATQAKLWPELFPTLPAAPR